MKTSILSALAVTSLLSISAVAGPYYSGISPNYSGPEVYVGAKVAQVSVEEDVVDSFEDNTTFGVMAGYTLNPYFGFELEYLQSNDADLTLLGTKGTYSTRTFNLYNTYRYTVPKTKAYIKARAGVSKADIDLDVPEMGLSDSSTGSGFTGGVGLGYKVNSNLHVEGAYTFIGGVVDAELISLNANYVF